MSRLKKRIPKKNSVEAYLVYGPDCACGQACVCSEACKITSNSAFDASSRTSDYYLGKASERG